MAAPGIDIIEVLQDDENFLVEKIIHKNNKAIRKTVKDSTPKRRRETFKNDPIGITEFKKLSKTVKKIKFRVPKIYKATNTCLISEYFEYKTLRDLLGTGREFDFLKKIADILAEIDKVIPVETQEQDHESATYKNITKRMDTWLETAMSASLISENDAQNAYNTINKYGSHISPKYAHGDLNPLEHCFVDDHGVLCFIDFENYSAIKPRYYDAAYCFIRVYSQANQDGLAGQFLDYFIQRCEAFNRADMIAVLTQRSVGLCFDAINDQKEGIDYTQKSKKLLDLCIQEDLEAILKL